MYLLKTVSKNGKAYKGFIYPLKVGKTVHAPDWTTDKKCGGGLHGLRDGKGDGSRVDWSDYAVWLVLQCPDEPHVDLGGKVKVPSAMVMHVGTCELRRVTPFWQKRIGGKAFDELHLCLGYPKRGDMSRTLVRRWTSTAREMVQSDEFGPSPVECYVICFDGGDCE